MRVLVDLDGVVADWGGGYNLLAGRLGLYDEGGLPYERRPTWDLRTGLTEVGIGINKTIMEYPGFYRNLEPIAGAQNAIHHLRNQGHDIWFVSTPYLSNPTCASDKLAWVNEHFGSSLMSRTILTMDKTLVNGDLLIDDRPLIEGTAIPTWRHICFGEYGYSGLTESKRARNWEEAQEEVILAQWERDLLNTKMVG